MRNVSLLGWLACAALPAWSDGISASRSEAELVDGQLSVSTRFNVKLSNTLYQTLTQGIPLSFRLEFELTRPRATAYYLSVKEWFDPHASMAFKLSYQPLTNRYRVTIGSLSTYYQSLDKALAALGAIQGWRVLEPGTLSGVSADKVAGRVKLELDIGELPKPFQLNALGSPDWGLASSWTNLDVKGGG
ncbi:DUF4390 domain-containing protein [Paludibacterium paludis]|uniref:DUF4390 domain-containing protein n=1 Tax=Paludibacterium paludis TaxID=1225769 RepID=A0A918NZW0_9NEIS|nr:DUF4390 domain-containing protein [Paludibacterium paludis]GGY09789.1 hypothetical protein GCM10011289_10840 [Paludibacterium paludis]